MPPLVVPITVNSGLNLGSATSNSSKTAIIMRVARCRRLVFTPFWRSLRRSSEICPAALQRHFPTSKRVTGETQSLLPRRAARVSSRPKPRGLITPAATTATRTGALFPRKSLNLTTSVPICLAILVAFQTEAPYTMCPKGENSSSEVRRLSPEIHSAAILNSISGNSVLAAFSRLDSMATKLYVGNLPFNTTENELQELFSQAGAVQEVMLMQDKFTGKSRGFAFVTMGSDQDAQKAIAEINGKTLEGRALTVNEARPREPRPPGGGGGGYGGGGDRRRDGGQ